ncbi:MAG: PilZ domain-containing protein [Terriglobia bacterium]
MRDETPPLKRRSNRKPVQLAVTLVIDGDEAEYLTTAADLSPLGLRLQSDATLAPGQPVGLLLGTSPDCFVKARVVWVGKADSDQAGQAGFEFLTLPTTPVC